ncbi:MAG: BamA/TamA family outer membrane protein [Bacteroidetes bacterium]|nr:BamA/TamA family outer membrane protein [Bacteroidota bacterium]
MRFTTKHKHAKNASTFKITFFILTLLFTGTLSAQTPDSISKLPFEISEQKKIPEIELKNKKENFYVVGIPNLSSDPINGFGAGIDGSVFYNGKRSDPFFPYTPYRMQLNIGAFITTKLQKLLYAKIDVPYIFNTKWRLRAIIGYGMNPNYLYFGTGETTLNGLAYYQNNTSNYINNVNYNDYENSLTGKKSDYNTYTEEGYFFNPTIEKSYMQGRLRVLLGYEIDAFNYTSPLNDSSMLAKDFYGKKILGFTKNFVSFAIAGITYDTRDLEADPSKGIFSEITNCLSLKAIGSQYNFNKFYFHFNLYQPLFHNYFKRLTFAARFGIGVLNGSAPFSEYQGQWSSETYITALGGGLSLRGYKQNRFIANVVDYANAEIRWRFLHFNFLKQSLAFSAVPFFDAGGVWNNIKRINHFENYRFSEGLGLRIAWNINTILRFDYAVSKEDKQFFFTIGHIF